MFSLTITYLDENNEIKKSYGDVSDLKEFESQVKAVSQFGFYPRHLDHFRVFIPAHRVLKIEIREKIPDELIFKNQDDDK